MKPAPLGEIANGTLQNGINFYRIGDDAEQAGKSQGNQPIARSNSHVVGGFATSRATTQSAKNGDRRLAGILGPHAINDHIVQVIVDKLGYSFDDVKAQVSDVDHKSPSFVANLYFRLLEEDQNKQAAAAQKNSQTHRGQHPHAAQNLLLSSQTSIGVSSYKQPNAQQNSFGQTSNNCHNYVAVQPSFVPSMKSLKSLQSCGGYCQTTNSGQQSAAHLALAQQNQQCTQASGSNGGPRPMYFNNTQPVHTIKTTTEFSPMSHSDASPLSPCEGRVMCAGAIDQSSSRSGHMVQNQMQHYQANMMTLSSSQGALGGTWTASGMIGALGINGQPDLQATTPRNPLNKQMFNNFMLSDGDDDNNGSQMRSSQEAGHQQSPDFKSNLILHKQRQLEQMNKKQSVNGISKRMQRV